MQMRETLFLRPAIDTHPAMPPPAEPQGRAMLQTPVTQMGRRLRRFHRPPPPLPIVTDTPPSSAPIPRTAAGFHPVAPAPQPATIPIPIAVVLRPPESSLPRTTSRRGIEDSG